MNNDVPVCWWKYANSTFDVAIRVCSESVVFKCTAGGSLRAIAVDHKVALKAKHRIRDPYLAYSTHLAARGGELVAVVEAVTDWITIGSTVET